MLERMVTPSSLTGVLNHAAVVRQVADGAEAIRKKKKGASADHARAACILAPNAAPCEPSSLPNRMACRATPNAARPPTRLRLRGIDATQPISRPRHGPRHSRRSQRCLLLLPPPQTRPTPPLRTLHQVRARRGA